MSQGASANSRQVPQGKSKEQRLSSPSLSPPNTRAAAAKRKTAITPAEAPTQKEAQKERHPSFEEARAFLDTNAILSSAESITPLNLAAALEALAISVPTKPPSHIKKSLLALSEIATKTDPRCDGCARSENLQSDIKTNHINAMQSLDNIQAKLEELDQRIQKPSPSQEMLTKVAEKIDSVAENINKATLMSSPVHTKHANNMVQQSSGASTYRDALMASPAPEPSGRSEREAQNEKAMAADAAERKERQVLIELDDDQILANSYETITEKAAEAMKQVHDPAPPADTSIANVIKLRKKGIIINFNSKEAARWLRHEDVAMTFSSFFFSGSSVKPRQYPIIVPRVPLTFDPENAEHLREVEEANLLDKNTITKARWIKPAYRRKPEQTVAHATLLLKDANQANKCIKEGLYVCGAKVFPAKLKQEPTQCMKCRKWGHYANECRDTKNTCGTCGGDHRTCDCTVEGKKYCVSCKGNAHASWDRKCPEFARRCDWFDLNHPDNKLKFYPTDDAWTHEIRPAKLPFTERFPMRYAVGSLPLPAAGQKERELPTRIIGKQLKRQKGKGKAIPGQTTLDGFLQGSQSRIDEELSEGEVESVISSGSAQDYSVEFITANDTTNC